MIRIIIHTCLSNTLYNVHIILIILEFFFQEFVMLHIEMPAVLRIPIFSVGNMPPLKA